MTDILIQLRLVQKLKKAAQAVAAAPEAEEAATAAVENFKKEAGL